jgi:type II secretory pathway component PulF
MAVRTPLDDFLLFNEELAATLKARLPLPDGIRHMAKQVRSRSFRNALARVEEDLREGRSLSEAIGRHGKYFSPIYIQALRAGEESGDLVSVLDYLNGYLSSAERIKQRIKGAAAYPLISFGVFLVVLGWVLWFVVPHFIQFWDEAGAMLPAPTQLLVTLSRLFAFHPLGPLIVVVAVVLFVRALLLFEPFREGWGMTVLFLPVIGRVARYLDLARFSQSMGFLLSSRVPLADALSLASGTLRNGFARRGVQRLSHLVREGHSLSGAMEKQYFFPDFYYWAISEGEIREELGQTFLDLGKHYQRWCEERLMGFGLLMEPALLLLMAGVVVFVVLALYLPLFKIGDIIR